MQGIIAGSVFRLSELAAKTVVNTVNGRNLGRVCDAELEESSGRITALLVPGRARLFGLFSRGEELRIGWERISLVGEDFILVGL